MMPLKSTPQNLLCNSLQRLNASIHETFRLPELILSSIDTINLAMREVHTQNSQGAMFLQRLLARTTCTACVAMPC